MITKTCIKCGKNWQEKPSHSWRRYCSMKCYNPIISVKKSCKVCKKKFIVDNYRKNIARYCSYKCRNFAYKDIFKGTNNPFYGKTQIPWNKGKQFLKIRGINHFAWKANKVGYHALHDWVRRYKGSPSTCEYCKKSGLQSKQINWANKSGKYLRKLTDWIRLCVSCHRKYDLYGR